MLGMALAGCSTTPLAPDKALLAPPKFAMAAPAPVPTIKAGDDIVIDDAKVRRQLGDEGDKVRTLQKWVRRVTKG
jgi:hypothetical protein